MQHRRVESLSVRDARRLALARAGLLKPEWTGFPRSGRGKGPAARAAALGIVERFGYLQLDTVSIAGARSHALVLLSRLPGLDPQLGEELLDGGGELFEYWGHEACWLPMHMYRLFEFRRVRFREHPWWGDVINSNRRVATRLIDQIRAEGPIRSVDMEGSSTSGGWWNFKIAKKVATALWSCGELAIRSRSSFIRTFDLTERVIPARIRDKPATESESLRELLLFAAAGHGWATRGTLASTWRIRNRSKQIKAALSELESSRQLIPCALEDEGKATPGWIRPEDLELAARLRRVRPNPTDSRLLSPFDPVLWDRSRVTQLFDFHMVLEIFKPAATRVYGYYCLPVLAGESFIGRVDLKADRKAGTLAILSRHFESTRPIAEEREAMKTSIARLSRSLKLAPI